MRRKYFCLFLIFWIVFAGKAQATSFNSGLIISDPQMNDYESMNMVSIQRFLEQKSSYLATYATEDLDGTRRGVAQLIFLAAQTYQVNPRYILVTMQKEQSLVEAKSPTQYQLDWATGYGRCDDMTACAADSQAVQKYKGLAKQIDYAASSMRFFYDNPDKTKFKVGQKSTIDGQEITIQNQATANLYTYTPHLHGNSNLWEIWQRWFGLYYPDGSLLQDKQTGEYWLIQNKQRRLIAKKALISGFDLRKLILADTSLISAYDIGRPIKYSQFSVFQVDKKLYLLSGDQIRLISDMKVFRSLGFNLDEVIKVTMADLQDFRPGPEINIKSQYPTGALLQDKKQGGIFYVENGVKYPLWDKALLKTNFSARKNVIRASSEKLSELSTGEPIKLQDGELVKTISSPTIYLISEGQRKPILKQETLIQLGYDFSKAIIVSEKFLKLHPEGEAIN